MDPFLEIMYSGKSFKTHVIPQGGQEPVWNDSFKISISPLEEQIFFKCFDEDLLDNDIVGETSLKVYHLCSEISSRKWLPLKYKGKKSAMILLETRFKVD
jgi:Ca2+-dependent lipid-binding protein